MKQIKSSHFVDVTKIVKIGSGNFREVEDNALTRYGFHLNCTNWKTPGSLD